MIIIMEHDLGNTLNMKLTLYICGPKDQSGLDGEVLEIENRC
jgi:hypothetical protein